MITAVAVIDAADVIGMKRRVTRGQRAQAVARQQLAAAFGDDSCLLCRFERAVGQADSYYLVRSYRGIVAVGSVDHVVESTAGSDESRKTAFGHARQLRVLALAPPEALGKFHHGNQRIVPQ